MKKLFFILFINTLLFCFAVNAQELPYKATYSSSFKAGSHELSKIVLDLYKAYEANDLNKLSTLADTVFVQLPNGQTVRGNAEAVALFKQGRESDGATTFTMDAIIPLVSTDKNENWVALWGTSQSSQGKMEFQSIWRINKDKKVDFIKLFNATPAQQ